MGPEVEDHHVQCFLLAARVVTFERGDRFMTTVNMEIARSRKALATALAAAVTLGGCAGSGTKAGSTAKGAAVGAAVGTVAGAVLGDGTRGTLTGTAAGAAVGGAIGWLFGREETELKQVLAPQREAQTAEVERVGEDTLKVAIDEAEAFEEGSAAIRESFLPTLDQIAGVLEKYPQSQVTVTGFAGADGPGGDGRRLSLERAEAVQAALGTYGVDPARVRAVGQAEEAAAGLPDDRSLEILIAPVA